MARQRRREKRPCAGNTRRAPTCSSALRPRRHAARDCRRWRMPCRNAATARPAAASPCASPWPICGRSDGAETGGHMTIFGGRSGVPFRLGASAWRVPTCSVSIGHWGSSGRTRLRLPCGNDGRARKGGKAPRSGTQLPGGSPDLPPARAPRRCDLRWRDIGGIAKRRIAARAVIGTSCTAATPRTIGIVGARTGSRIVGDALADETLADLGIGLKRQRRRPRNDCGRSAHQAP